MSTARATAALSLLLAAALAMALFAGATRPMPNAPVAQVTAGPTVPGLADEPEVGDKLAHLLAGLLFALALVPAARLVLPRWSRGVLLVGIGAALGVGIELLQTRVPGREASVDDALAVALGAFVVASLASLWWLVGDETVEAALDPVDGTQG